MQRKQVKQWKCVPAIDHALTDLLHGQKQTQTKGNEKVTTTSTQPQKRSIQPQKRSIQPIVFSCLYIQKVSLTL